jgi:hypothetical protein
VFAEKTTQLITIHSDVPVKPNNPTNKTAQKAITPTTFTEGLDQRQPIPELLVARPPLRVDPENVGPELIVFVLIVVAKTVKFCGGTIKK